MRINAEKCIICGLCVPHCPVGAIITNETSYIDAEVCVECGVCLRADVCKPGAIEQTPLSWPRVLRSLFSDPLTVHPETDIGGRGTEEMKTNDVTHRFKCGEIGVAVELGRPVIGTTFQDVETVAKVLAPLNLEFEPRSPVTSLIDPKTGVFLDPEVKKEKALTAIIEMVGPREVLPEVISALREVESKIETVMTIGIITTCENSVIPILSILNEENMPARINGKVNLGLGLAWSYK